MRIGKAEPVINHSQVKLCGDCELVNDYDTIPSTKTHHNFTFDIYNMLNSWESITIYDGNVSFYNMAFYNPGYSTTAEYAAEVATFLDGLTGVNAHNDGSTVVVRFSLDTSDFNCGETVTVTQAFGQQITTTILCEPTIVNHPYWSCEPTYSGYDFGFNGQEKDDQVSGASNSYTAEFWQYDPRLGRRWNRDPVVKHNESPYACFANNPIAIIDPDGRDSILVNDDGTINSVFERSGDHRIFNSKEEEFKFNDYNLDKQQLEDMLPSKKGGVVLNSETGEVSKSRYEWDYVNEPIKLFYHISEQKALGFINDAGANELRIKNEIAPFGRYTRAIAYGHGNFDFLITLQRNYSGQTAEENGILRTNFTEGTGGFFVFGGAKAIYNLHDAGNFLTGGAFNVADYAWWELSWGAEFNEWFNFRAGDSDADQKALKEGFNFYFWNNIKKK